MKNLKFILISYLIFWSAQAQIQQITVGSVKDIQVQLKTGSFINRAEWNALTYYLQGVIEGVVSYHDMSAHWVKHN